MTFKVGQVFEQGSMLVSLETLAREAAQALISLEADRLEELTAACQSLISYQSSDTCTASAMNGRLVSEISSLGLMLEITRANLCVLRRASQGRTNYSRVGTME